MMTSIESDGKFSEVEGNQGCPNEECRAKIRELGEQVVGLRKRLQRSEGELLKQKDANRDFHEAERTVEETTRRYRELRMEADVVECELGKARGDVLRLSARVTRMISGVIEGCGKDAAYSRLVASMTVDELEGVVPGAVKEAGEAGGGVTAVVAAIGLGSEEGVVWGAKRYSVDVGGVKVKSPFGRDRDVDLVEYASERSYVRGVVVGVLCELVEGGAGGVVGKDGSTPLHWAAARGRVEMCRMHVGAGVDVNAKSSNGSTALHIAAINGHERVCEVLVGLGADVGAVNGSGDTAADDARSQGHEELSTRLGTMAAWGRRVDGVDEGRLVEIAREVVGDGMCGRGVALVGVGIEGGSGAVIRQGVEEGEVNLNGLMWDGWRSIRYAIGCGDSGEAVDALIGCGADANWDGGVHLRDAARWGRVRVCEALIRGGVDVNTVDGGGDTALQWAAVNGRREVCELLVASGANVGAVNKRNKTAAARAREFGHEGVAMYLEGQR